MYARYSKTQSGAQSLIQAQVTSEWRIGDFDTLAAEIRRVEEQRTVGEAAGLLGALKYTHRFGDTFDLYGQAQLTLDDDHGKYADNDAYTVGGKYLFGNLSSVGAEVTSGDRGDAATVNAEYRLTPDHSLYGAYTATHDDTQAYDPLFNNSARDGWTLGQRWRLSNQINVFNESQFLKDDTAGESGLAHTFGLISTRRRAGPAASPCSAAIWSTAPAGKSSGARSASAWAAPRPIRIGLPRWNGGATPVRRSASSGCPPIA